MKITGLFILFAITGCLASNILVMLPMPMYSHTANFLSIFNELGKRGHNVTIVSPYFPKNPNKNLIHIKVNDFLSKIMSQNGKPINALETTGLFFNFVGIWMLFPNLSLYALDEEPVRQVINDTTSSYDLVITEVFFGHEPFLALGHKFNAPVVAINSGRTHPVLAYFTGNHFPTSYVANYKFPSTDRMTFLERASNTFAYIWEVYGPLLYYLPKQESTMRTHFKYPGSENLPSITDLMRNISLTIIESHLAIRYPIPFHDNIVEIGGIYLKDGDKLPADLQQFMDDAPNGIVYFSFGSHFNTSFVPENITSTIFNTLGKLKQKVLMKWAVPPANKPANIKIASWLPQASLLGHPNCKAFVTHGGLHGVIEGFYHGIPMVGMPLFADQCSNLKMAENFEAAVVIKLKEVTEENFSEALNAVLNDKHYKLNAMKRRSLLRDRPMNPVDEAVFWIEYVLRHKGAGHLRPAVLDIPLYQYLLLDVMLFFAAILTGVLGVLIGTIIVIVKCGKLMCKSKAARVDSVSKAGKSTKKKPKKE